MNLELTLETLVHLPVLVGGSMQVRKMIQLFSWSLGNNELLLPLLTGISNRIKVPGRLN